ncbi:TPM domain-containing protein [Apilactobacillus xinyiensis]|uniref:TPM domain-containing protein n=1 Tax=Apilactobacillus xinyiensis TaxID=2841032 RepID=UPI001C7D223F|nr:TPM domain-containing protein [Apilactobacillus xinyiensis]MCL0319457.1 TPM domain-containing protein [Apilactobacillus xinyiensis]
MKKVRLLMMFLVSTIMFVFSFNGFISHADSTNPIPTKEYVVNDYVNVLSNQTKEQIIQQEKQYQKTDAKPQIVVMTIKSTNGQSIDDYANDLLQHDRWHFGKKGLDNGVLILFAQNNGNNNVRISTGYGVEDILTDAQSNDILMKNKFLLKSSKKSNIDEGIRNVFNQVSKIISKRYANKSLQQIKKEQAEKQKHDYIILFLALITIAIIIFIIIKLSKNNNHHNGSGTSGGNSGWLLPFLIGTSSGHNSSSDFGGFGSSGGFSDSGGGGDFGGGGSSI